MPGDLDVCGRLGISVVLSHQVSPGYGSDIEGGAILTLEIVSHLSRAVFLRPGTRIGNLMLLRCSPVERCTPRCPPTTPETRWCGFPLG
ncbi:hypothetical protein GCM10010464_17190 [Pseudonocardia yunnanensis]